MRPFTDRKTTQFLIFFTLDPDNNSMNIHLSDANIGHYKKKSDLSKKKIYKSQKCGIIKSEGEQY